MARYRFPCPKCGHVATVTEDQAGSSFRCAECGNAATLPTLMQIRRLEPEASERSAASADPLRIERARSRRGWGAGLFTIGLLLALLGGGGAIAFWYVRSNIEVFDIDRSRLQEAYQQVHQATAADAFLEWKHQRERDLEEEFRTKPQHIQNREQHAAMGTAMTVSLVMLILGIAFAVAGGWSLLSAELRDRDANGS